MPSDIDDTSLDSALATLNSSARRAIAIIYAERADISVAAGELGMTPHRMSAAVMDALRVVAAAIEGGDPTRSTSNVAIVASHPVSTSVTRLSRRRRSSR